MAVIGLEGCNTSLHPENQIGEASTLMVCVWRVLSSSRGPPIEAVSFVLASSMGELGRPAEHSQEQFPWAGPSGILPVGPHCLRWHHWGRRHKAPSLPSILGCSPPKGMVGLKKVGWTSPPRTGGPVHRPLFSPTAPL